MHGHMAKKMWLNALISLAIFNSFTAEDIKIFYFNVISKDAKLYYFINFWDCHVHDVCV